MSLRNIKAHYIALQMNASYWFALAPSNRDFNPLYNRGVWYAKRAAEYLERHVSELERETVRKAYHDAWNRGERPNSWIDGLTL